MLKYFRKWSIALKRRRLRKERALLQRYVSIEENTRGDGGCCNNCNAPLTGPFCHICGQKDDDLRRPIWTFFKELFNAIFDTDSKIIKTILFLVLIPGGLSRAFMEGKRARFLPPFRLYVVLLFVFFSTLNLADVLIIDIHVEPKADNVAAREALEAEAARKAEEITAAQIKDAERLAQETAAGVVAALPGDIVVPELPELEGGLAKVSASEQIAPLIAAIGSLEAGDQEKIEEFEAAMETFVKDIALGNTTLKPEDLAIAQQQARELLDRNAEMVPDARNALQGLLALSPEVLTVAASTSNGGINIGDLPYNFDIAMFVPNDNTERDGIKQKDIDFVLENDDTPEIVKKIVSGFAEGLRSPREFNKLFNEWLPWALVIMMPVFALILRATHWGQRRYYLNQLVFALHFHSFLFVMLTAFAFIVPAVGGENAFTIFWWGTSLYLIIALKVGQNQGWLRSFFKAGFIWVSYFGFMMVTMMIVMMLGISDTSLGEFVTLLDEASSDGASSGTPESVGEETGTSNRNDAPE